MSSAFPRPTISAANGCAIIAAFPLNRLHNRMRPIDADRVYTSTAQVALTILLQNGDPMLIVELTRLLLQWLCIAFQRGLSLPAQADAVNTINEGAMWPCLHRGTICFLHNYY